MNKASIWALALLWAEVAASATSVGTITDRLWQPKRGSTNVGSPVATSALCWEALRKDAETRKASTATGQCINVLAATITYSATPPPPPPAPPPPPPAPPPPPPPPPPAPPPPVVLGTWSGIATATVNPVFTPEASVYPNAGGITFYRNGLINRTDGTGPEAGSVFEMYPAVTLVNGDVLRAEWTDKAGTARVSTLTVGGTAEPPAPPPPPSGAAASLSWDAHPDPTVTGYRVYSKLGTAAYPAMGSGVAVPTNSYSFTTLAPGTWCFTVTATRTGAESALSNEACKVVP